MSGVLKVDFCPPPYNLLGSQRHRRYENIPIAPLQENTREKRLFCLHNQSLISVTKTLPVHSCTKFQNPNDRALFSWISAASSSSKNYYHELSLGGTTTTDLDLVLFEHDGIFVSLLQFTTSNQGSEKI